MSNLTPPSPFAEKPTRHPTLCWSGYRLRHDNGDVRLQRTAVVQGVNFPNTLFALDDGANSAIIHRAQSFHRPQKGWQR
jgi:hypothetical protein